MRVAKWGNSLAIRIPKDVADALSLEEGQQVEIERSKDGVLRIARKPNRTELIQQIRRMAKPLPPGWKFDRDEANAR